MFENVAAQYATRLKATLDADLKTTEAVTQPRDLRDTGGPGIEFDLVQLAIEATALAGGYLVWKEVATDIRAVVSRLRRLSGSHVIVDEAAAVILAVDALSTVETFADVEIRFVAPLSVPDDEMGETRGFLVGVTKNGKLLVVALDADGLIVGTSEALSDIGLDRFGL
ncbi:MAG: hypothetical protein M3082_11670 [Candidatus Dormibacteraeota bacterium]|nr:hypothetical protein [Candidatus Dormibacteraeota bacterium]